MLRRASPDPEDDPKPVLVTPRRVATQLEGIHLELSRAGCRMKGIACYLESSTANDLVEQICDLTKRLAELRGGVLVGEVRIAKGLDEESWRESVPLLARIEEAGANGHLPASPIRRITELEEQFPDAVWGQWGAVAIGELELDPVIESALRSHGADTAGAIVARAKYGLELYDLLDAQDPKEAARRAEELADELINHFSAFTQGMPMPTKRAERAKAEAWPYYQILHASKGDQVLALLRAPDPGSAIAMGRKRKACKGLARDGFDCRETQAPVNRAKDRARTPQGRSSSVSATAGASVKPKG